MKSFLALASSKNFKKINPASKSLELSFLILLIAFALLCLYYGWRLFWFLTDDAFIAFRYVSNSVLGYGYVWNPPPFTPVEGYTSFLWVFLLDVVWCVLGIMPPESANWLSLVFSCFTMIMGTTMVYRINWRPEFRKFRMIFLFLFLVAILTNRTFLTWTSSGLETAMFNFFLIYWVYANYYLQPPSFSWVWGVSISTSLLYLTRPDGLLFALGTGLMLLYAFISQSKIVSVNLKNLMAILPLGIIPLHLMWRKYTYGLWLPNTFYTKTSPGLLWVKSGAYYLLSFVIEYSLWFFIGLIALFAIKIVFREKTAGTNLLHRTPSADNYVRAITLVVLAVHFGYYTFIVGGDYFEYRVYSYLIVLIYLSSIRILNNLTRKPLIAVVFYIGFVVASLPIPWSHWYFTRNMTTREDTKAMMVNLSATIQRKVPGSPETLIKYLQVYDNLQSWLIDHYICVRHQEHKVLWQSLTDYYPSREEGSLVTSEDFPVATQEAVGILSWVLPHVNIVDLLGLNDYVIARNPDLNPRMQMAHLRQPPDGYVDCFDPNVKIRKSGVTIKPRVVPMTEDKIVYCESHYLQIVNELLQK